MDMAELWLNRALARDGSGLRRLHVEGAGDMFEVRLDTAWRGFHTHVRVRLTELRLHRRFVGCRVAAVSGPMGIRLPVSVVGRVARELGRGHLRFYPDDGIVILDLREVLPEGFDLRVRGVVCRDRRLSLELGGGSWSPAATGPAELRTGS